MQAELKKYKEKKKPEEFIMPNRENYNIVLSQNFTIKQLKDITGHYKIKLNGATVKSEIMAKICNYFKSYEKAIVIQNAYRQYLFKQYNKLRGPARFRRSICVNDTDFFTMDSLSDIPYNQFFSFMDKDKMIYGFDIMSIFNLFNKGANGVGANGVGANGTNPYNRNPFPTQVARSIIKIIRLSKIFKEPINLDTNEGEEKNIVLNIENRIIMLFNEIDHLGNYTNYNWFMSLNQIGLMRFIIEINDIWSYRANLSEEVKREICPEHRDLFHRMFMIDLRVANIPILREIAIDIMNKLVRDGINYDSRCLGANFVLCALTLANQDAADALPWLYQSVM